MLLKNFHTNDQDLLFHGTKITSLWRLACQRQKRHRNLDASAQRDGTRAKAPNVVCDQTDLRLHLTIDTYWCFVCDAEPICITEPAAIEPKMHVRGGALVTLLVNQFQKPRSHMSWPALLSLWPRPPSP